MAPYNFDAFEEKVKDMETPELQQLKHKYTASCGGSSIGAAASLALGPLAPIGLAVAALSGGNAAGKLTIITRELRKRKENALLDLTKVAKGQLGATVMSQFGHGAAHLTHSEAIGFVTEQGLEYGKDKVSEARRNGRTSTYETSRVLKTEPGVKCPGCKMNGLCVCSILGLAKPT